MSGVWDWAGLWWKDGRRGGEGEGRTEGYIDLFLMFQCARVFWQRPVDGENYGVFFPSRPTL